MSSEKMQDYIAKIIYEEDNRDNILENKLNIFSQLKNKNIVKSEQEKCLYKIKLNFLEGYYDDNLQDLEMCLYECKRLKN